MGKRRVVTINVVGLTRGLIGEHTPAIAQFAENGCLTSFPPAFPAVTCTAQSTYLTGKSPSDHGIVGNGWYDREAAEVKFWKQSNHLVHGEKIWEKLREERVADESPFTCAKMFWWYNMYASVNWSITPRPLYPVDGSKVFDVHTQPMDLREQVKSDLGPFPFPAFWGPAAGIASSEWIAESAMWIEKRHQPSLNLVYLPHLDYSLQQWGPNDSRVIKELQAIDGVVAKMIEFFSARDVEIVLLSEYGISEVSRPIHINREFRKRGWIQVKDELGRETLDAGASRAFAVADHQIAHIYINDPSIRDEVMAVLQEMDGVEEVRQSSDLWEKESIASTRAGELIAVAEHDAWFTYYFWLDDAFAPDYARCIDIHRKPGYDPVELFIDPHIAFPKLKIATFLLKKRLGMRAVLDVIPLDASLIRGSHGRDRVPESEQPVFITQKKHTVKCAEDVFGAIVALFNKENL